MVKPPVMATSLQRPLFWQIVHTLYIDYCLNLSMTATFFCPQGGCCGGVQLYCKIHWSIQVSGKLPTYPSPKPTFCPNQEVGDNLA